MIKTLQFGDKNIQFSTSFAWAFIYKSQFGKDAAKVLLPAIEKVLLVGGNNELESEDQETAQAIMLFEELGFTGIVEISWSMARLCDKTIPEPIQWVESFGDDFEPLTLVTEIITEAMTSCFASKEIKNQTAPLHLAETAAGAM